MNRMIIAGVQAISHDCIWFESTSSTQLQGISLKINNFSSDFCERGFTGAIIVVTCIEGAYVEDEGDRNKRCSNED